jgi:hypothetical protein
MNMHLLPCPANKIIKDRSIKGMLYGPTSDFKIGKPQPVFISCCGLIFVWMGCVDIDGTYFYTNARKCRLTNIKV